MISNGHTVQWLNLPLDSEHLDTMKKIEQLRRMYGEEDWLHSQGAEQVHAVLGIEKLDPRSVAEIVAQRLADEERRKEDINKFVEQATASVLARSAIEQMGEQGQFDTEEQDSFEERVRAKGAAQSDRVEKQETPTAISEKGTKVEDELVSEKKKSEDMTASVYGVYTGGVEGEDDPADLRITVRRKLSADLNESSEDIGQRQEHDLILRITHDTIREETPSGLTLETWFMHRWVWVRAPIVTISKGSVRVRADTQVTPYFYVHYPGDTTYQ